MEYYDKIRNLIAKTEYEGKCPYCGSKGFKVEGQYVDEAQVSLEVVCNDCEEGFDLWYDFSLIQYKEKEQ